MQRIPQWLFLISCLFLVVSCSSSNLNQQKIASTPENNIESVSLLLDGQDTFQNVSAKIDSTGRVWLPVQAAMETLNFKSQFDDKNQAYRFGYTDPLYTVKVGDATAIAGEVQRTLPQPPQFWDNQLFMTTEALSTWLNTDVNWNKGRHEVNVSSISLEEAGDGVTTQSKANLSGTDLVRYAQRFLGVPYEFGAGSYAQTGTFDCSSFTQYVYDRFGVSIPRSSRGQSDVGSKVDTKALGLVISCFSIHLDDM